MSPKQHPNRKGLSNTWTYSTLILFIFFKFLMHRSVTPKKKKRSWTSNHNFVKSISTYGRSMITYYCQQPGVNSRAQMIDQKGRTQGDVGGCPDRSIHVRFQLILLLYKLILRFNLKIFFHGISPANLHENFIKFWHTREKISWNSKLSIIFFGCLCQIQRLVCVHTQTQIY